MREKLPGRVVAGREQQSRPVDAVEAEDVLAQQVARLGPERGEQVLALARVRERAQIIDERVGPDVGDLALVPRQRDTPGLRPRG